MWARHPIAGGAPEVLLESRPAGLSLRANTPVMFIAFGDGVRSLQIHSKTMAFAIGLFAKQRLVEGLPTPSFASSR